MRHEQLKAYQKKRDFKKTAEPKPKIKKQTKQEEENPPTFVVQKHHARSLHYDFRIEYKGVLVSWAIPKGPSRTKGIKRLAVAVEDHPLSYGSFEGEIPQGQYGAGKVEIWDHGVYLEAHSLTRKESEKNVKQGLLKGHLSLVLQGKKLKGIFDLILLKAAEKPNQWIILKR